jgi:hypothetical protein
MIEPRPDLRGGRPQGTADLSRRWSLAGLVGIIVFATAFRLWELGEPSLWLDELFSVGIGSLPQDQLWSNWMVRETNPPLHYSLLHTWMDLFGRDEFSTRALSVVCGALSIPVIYLIGHRLHSRRAGLVAALLVAVSGQHLQYSQQARGYALGFLAAALALYALLRLTDRWLDGSQSRRGEAFDLALFAGATSVAFYTHTTFFLLPVLANLYVGWLWWFRLDRRGRVLAGWVLANLAVLALCGWWIWITFQQVSTEGGAAPISWIARPSARKALLIARDVFATREFGMADSLFALIFAGLGLWGLTRLTLERRVLMALIWAGVPVLLLLTSLKQPVYLDRTLFWALVAFLPVLAVGAVSLPRRRLALIATAGIVGVLFLDAAAWRHRYYREPWRDIAAVVAARAGPNDALLVGGVSTMTAFRYYCANRCERIRHVTPKSPPQEVLRDGFRGVEVLPGSVHQALQGVDRVWVVHRREKEMLDQFLVGSAVQENPNVLASDPLVTEQAAKGRMRLSLWRVLHQTPDAVAP